MKIKQKDEKFKKYRADYKESQKEYQKIYHRDWHKKHSISIKNNRIKDRKMAMHHYSNGTMSCACCNESTYEFLVFDHINGGGNRHRTEIMKKYNTRHISRYLIKNKFPEGFQVLCYNCNMAKSVYGKCPHKL